MLLDNLRREYIGSGRLQLLLAESKISILTEFLQNWSNIKKFHAQFYKGNYPKVVLCGVNPGRNGAGKIGIPFLDFSSVSELLENVNRQDTERSAQFFFEIVKHFGPERFYRSFYVTNFSWVGYIKDNNNKNYYSLPKEAQVFVNNMFKYEMSIIKPSAIISLSRKVCTSVRALFEGGEVDTSSYLHHPNHCAFPKNRQTCKDGYIETLAKYVEPA